MSKRLLLEVALLQSKQMEYNPNQNFAALQRQQRMFTGPFQFSKRRRTDVFCTYFGVVFFATCIGLSIGLKNEGNLTKFKHPTDSSGNICEKDFPQHPFLYLTNLPDISQRICVQSCPKTAEDALKCKPTATISCIFGEGVIFIETQPQSDHNGNICMPIDAKLKKAFIERSQLKSRISFYNPIILLTYQITIALSIVLMVLLNHHPRGTMEATQYLSLIGELMLAIIVYIQHTEHKAIKYFVICILAVAFFISVSQILIFRQELKLNRVFMAVSSKFWNENKGLSVYILIFELMLGGFFLLLREMFNGLTSNSIPIFDPKKSLYYQKDLNSFLLAALLLTIFGIWGISLIQELFNFCISAHTINWYLKIPNDCQSVFKTLKLLFIKHLGSVIASGFLNGFLFLPQAILQLFRSCKNSKLKSNFCLWNAIDLARDDTLGFIILAGTPYCNASKYCQYLWNESMISEQTQSSIRIYKLAAHMLIATICSIIGLFIRGEFEPYLLAFTLNIGLFITTFFIEFNAVCSETLELLYIMEEEFYKRREGRAKTITNVLNKDDQLSFLLEIQKIFSNLEVAQELRNIRKDYWKLKLQQKITDNRRLREADLILNQKEQDKTKANITQGQSSK